MFNNLEEESEFWRALWEREWTGHRNGLKVDGNAKISSLEDGKQDKFLDVLESLKQEEKLALQSAAKEYLQRWEGLHSTETEYKATKVEAVVNLYQKRDLTMKMVRDYEEHAESVGRQALTKEEAAYVREYGPQLQLEYSDPVCVTEEGEVIPGKKVKNLLKRHRESRIREDIREQRWHGKLVTERERDAEQSAERCFLWLSDWRICPTHIAGMFKLYEQLLPSRLYTIHKTRVSDSSDSACRLCGTATEGIARILSACPVLAQTKYLTRHDAVLKVLFFEIIFDLSLIDTVFTYQATVSL
ncbi:hypothetical protein AWC38_SpisGene23186 [Stylophora pistillata]|uniref:Reverse transcriptase zinc-binding domain-containing protein n=1 Tax=Stylophora pistillata TaxID=50429 RepID=A0A2B4R374_STYPI|nr:hypothetical protein AWC38_SpisGene23186 [Stylophora pistillata]